MRKSAPAGARDDVENMQPLAPIRKVLVVDHERDMRTFLCRLLETGGYETCLAADVPEGLELTAQEKPDLILLEAIPGPGGCLEMLDILKGDDSFKEIPVVLLSSLDERDFVSTIVPARPADTTADPAGWFSIQTARGRKS